MLTTGDERLTDLLSNKPKMLNFEMTSLKYFDNISFNISPNDKKLDSSKIYTKWAVEKCPILNF